ncbi:MAG: hypothetical protein PUE26_07995 [Ruminococcus sp.]|nr:hypothetical protein [Ruminococcus sp.]MDD6710073.1 hypothetical protein [Ruminococcus sp.]
MKKLITILIAASLLTLCGSCGNNAELEALKKENSKLRQELSKVTKAEQIHQSTVNQTISLNEPFEVSTEFGNYKVTITGAEIKDWRERSQGTIENLNLLLNYTVENISFSNDTFSGCYVDSSFFYVYDDNKTLLDTASSSYDTQFPQVVLPGYNGQFNLCYDLNKEDTKYIDVVIHRRDEQYKDKILGQMQINLQ